MTINTCAYILHQIDLIFTVWSAVSTFMAGTLFSLVYLYIAERREGVV